MDRMTSGMSGGWILGPAAAVLMLAGTAGAQSAPAQGGYDKPMARKARVAVAAQPEAQSGGKAAAKSHSHVNISQNDDGGSYTITIDGDDIEASINGEDVPADRIQRDDDTVKLLDENGNVVAEFHVSAGGAWVGEGHAAAGGHGAWMQPDPVRGFAFVPGQAGGGGAGGAFGGTVINPPPVMLGITMGEPSESLLDHLGLEPGSAVLIGKVYEGLPADQAGMQDDDILVQFDGTQPLTEDKVREILRSKNPGDEIKVKVIRKGATKDLKIKLQAYDAEKLGGSTATGETELFTPQDMQGLSWWSGAGGAEARQAIEEAMKEVEKSHGMNGDEVREQVHKALAEALKSLDQGGANTTSGRYRLQVSPRALAGPGGGQVILGPRPGQVYSVPGQPVAPTPPRNGDLSRQIDELRAQLDEVQRSRDELSQQLDEIKSMLKDMRDHR